MQRETNFLKQRKQRVVRASLRLTDTVSKDKERWGVEPVIIPRLWHQDNKCLLNKDQRAQSSGCRLFQIDDDTTTLDETIQGTDSDENTGPQTLPYFFLPWSSRPAKPGWYYGPTTCLGCTVTSPIENSRGNDSRRTVLEFGLSPWCDYPPGRPRTVVTVLRLMVSLYSVTVKRYNSTR